MENEEAICYEWLLDNIVSPQPVHYSGSENEVYHDSEPMDAPEDEHSQYP
jgi:hypothetical protein